MAESVQFLLEDTVPELEDLRKLGLFSRQEIKSVVKRRTAFEYALKRRVMRKADVLRYATYEINLDALRRLRKKTKGVTKSSISDHTMVRRIHFIFERGLRKFGGDLRLWLQFIDYAKRSGSRQTLSRLFARALQFHPLQSGIWIMAASWESNDNGNVVAARTLMQRGLRLCADDENMWVQYFRLEMLYWAKVKTRQELLFGGGADVATAAAIEEPEEQSIEVPVLPHEKGAAKSKDDLFKDEVLQQSLVSQRTAAADGNVVDNMKNKFMKGSIPLAVYSAATKAIPASLSLRRALVQVAEEIGAPKELLDAIYGNIASEFAADAYAAAIVCERGFPANSKLWATWTPAEFTERVTAVYNNYVAYVKKHPQPAIVEHMTRFFSQITSDVFQHRAFQATAAQLCQQTLALAQSSKALQSEGLWISIVEQKLREVDSLTEALQLSTKARVQFPTSGALLLQRARLGVIAAEDMRQLLKLVDDALPQIKSDGEDVTTATEIVRWRFAAAATLLKDDLDGVQARLSRYVEESSRRYKKTEGELQGKLLLWVCEQRGLVAARQLADKYLGRPAPSKALVDTCFQLEAMQQRTDLLRMRKLHEILVGQQPQSSEPWLEWIKFELQQSQFDHLQILYQRALKTVRDTTSFVSQYNAVVQV